MKYFFFHLFMKLNLHSLVTRWNIITMPGLRFTPNKREPVNCAAELLLRWSSRCSYVFLSIFFQIDFFFFFEKPDTQLRSNFCVVIVISERKKKKWICACIWFICWAYFVHIACYVVSRGYWTFIWIRKWKCKLDDRCIVWECDWESEYYKLR